MAAGEEKLKLVLTAVDKTLAPLRGLTRRIEAVNAPVKRVRKAFEDLAKAAGLPGVAERLKTIAGWARNLALGAIAAGAGVLEFARRTADAADNLSEMTRQIGIGVEDFQEFQYAAKRAGIDGDKFSTAMQFMTKKLGSLNLGTHDTSEAFLLLLKKLRSIQDPMKRNAFAAKVFGRSGQKMALMATQSAAEFENLRKRARELGGVLSQESANAAEDLMDSIDDLTLSVGGLARDMVAALFPDLKQAAELTIAWIREHRVEIIDKAKIAIKGFGEFVRKASTYLETAIPKVEATVMALGGVENVLKGIAALALAPVVRTVIALAMALGAVGSAVLGTGAAMAYLLIQFEKLTGIKQKILDVIDPFDAGSSLGAFIRTVNDSTPARPRTMNLHTPGKGAGVNAAKAASAARARADSIDLNIMLDGAPARVGRARTSLPGTITARGVALSPN